MRSEWWTLDTVGDWGMLGRVRDLASMGLCNFLSSDLVGRHKQSISEGFLFAVMTITCLWDVFTACSNMPVVAFYRT